VIVRTAAPEDLAALRDIYAHYVLHSTATFEEVPPTRDEWRRRMAEIAAQGLPLLAAEAGGVIAGYAYGTRWRSRTAYRHTIEDSVYVAPGAVGRGIGSLLLRELLIRCAAAGRKQVIAVIADGAEAPASVALHRRHGFDDAGRLVAVGFKHGCWLDTILMQRSLDGGDAMPGTPSRGQEQA